MKRWSTKSAYIEMSPSPSPGRAGTAVFECTDDYSVFHFSKMPDRIPDKGEVIARMTHTSLTLLEASGLRTHLLAYKPPRGLSVRLLNVLDPAQGQLAIGDTARLVPLQVIYRNLLGPGASVYRRAKAGKVTLQDLGLTALPPPNAPLARPIIEFTTKLENIDRFIGREEARAIACLSPDQFEQMQVMTLHINTVLSRHAEARGLVLADGKIEFGIDEDGELILVDAAGTPDENRFVLNGIEVSKQILRDFYHGFGLEADVQRLAASDLPRSQWPAPSRLPADLIAAFAEMYRSLCERWTDTLVWNAKPLDVAAAEAEAALHRHLVCPPEQRSGYA